MSYSRVAYMVSKTLAQPPSRHDDPNIRYFSPLLLELAAIPIAHPIRNRSHWLAVMFALFKVRCLA